MVSVVPDAPIIPGALPCVMAGRVPAAANWPAGWIFQARALGKLARQPKEQAAQVVARQPRAESAVQPVLAEPVA